MQIRASLSTDYKALDVEPFDPVRPEKNLLAAVLERAVADAIGDSECLYLTDQADRREGYEWIVHGPIGGSALKLEPWSYGWICAHLEIDPVSLRQAIIYLKSKGIKYHRLSTWKPKSPLCRKNELKYA